MPMRVAFQKLTHEGLSVDVEDFEGQPILFLGKDAPTAQGRPIQILGVATREINTATLLWHYEYEPLPGTRANPKLVKHLESLGYSVGVFDQFGNFRKMAA